LFRPHQLEPPLDNFAIIFCGYKPNIRRA
jgi:hypothetical protein